MNQKLVVRKTKLNGNGIYASGDIKKNELLNIAGGYVMTADEESKLPEKFRDSGLQIAENFVLSNKKELEIEDSGYFNHSCEPNAGFHGQIFLVAMRNIKRGEEITFDYAMVLHQSKNVKKYKMKCLCGEKYCRGFITDSDWKKKELQKKYDGYFQYFLQEKINKIKIK